MCLLYKEICICSLIEIITLKTRVTLIAYQKELLRMTNTGRLTGLCLSNHKIIEKDRAGVEYKPEEILCDDYTNLVLYPEGAQELNRHFIDKSSKPINLIVPDGTWRQTRKIFRSEKLLHSVTRVTLPTDNPDYYFLRKPQKEFYFSTFEAISRALEIIETRDVYVKLKTVFDEMTIRLLKRNGKISQQNINHGNPHFERVNDRKWRIIS